MFDPTAMIIARARADRARQNRPTRKQEENRMGMDRLFTLFDAPGKENTRHALELGYDRGRELGINEVVVASSTGDTAYQALGTFKDFRIIAVTYHCGFAQPFEKTMKEDVRKDLEEEGVKVIEASHALSGVERGIARKHGGVYPALLMADTLRMFGHGTKVAVEITLMAADGGALSGNDVIAVGGTGRGADTALVIQPAHPARVFDLKVREVICKPRNF